MLQQIKYCLLTDTFMQAYQKKVSLAMVVGVKYMSCYTCVMSHPITYVVYVYVCSSEYTFVLVVHFCCTFPRCTVWVLMDKQLTIILCTSVQSHCPHCVVESSSEGSKTESQSTKEHPYYNFVQVKLIARIMHDYTYSNTTRKPHTKV